MRKLAGFGAEISALLVGLVIGIGTNLLSAQASKWPDWLHPIDTWSPLWLPLFILAFIVMRYASRAGKARRHPWPRDKNPFPGLERYGAERAAVYFGREKEAQELRSRLDAAGVAPASRFIAVAGRSGVGKSSLVHAGLLPGVRKATIVRMPSPGPAPLADLTRALLPDATADQISGLRSEAELPERPGHLLDALTVARNNQERLIIVIDQLEGVSRSSPEFPAFLETLQRALRFDGRVVIVATVRLEFLGVFSPVAPTLFDYPYVLGPLPEAQLRRVVELPFRAAARELDPGLAGEIAADAAGPGALPLLSAVLTQLYQTPGSGALTTADYDATGRVSGVVAAQADSAVDNLRSVMTIDAVLETLICFVQWQPEIDQPGRRRAARSEFTDEEFAVVEEFVAARLLVSADDDTFEVAHEAVFDNWEPLRQAIHDRAPALRLLAEVTAAARLWQSRPREQQDGYLLTGSRLREAWSMCEQVRAPEFVLAFLRRSQTEFDRAQQEEERRRAEAERARAEAERARAEAAAAAGPRADNSAWHAQHITDQTVALTVARAAIVEYRSTPYADLTLALHTPGTRRSLGQIPQRATVAWSAGGRLAVRVAAREILVFAGPDDASPRRLRSPADLGLGLVWDGDRLIANTTSFRGRDLIAWTGSAETGDKLTLPTKLRLGLDFMFGFERVGFSELAWQSEGVLAESGRLRLQSGSTLCSPAARLWVPSRNATEVFQLPMTSTTDVKAGPIGWSADKALAVGGTGLIRIWNAGPPEPRDLRVQGTTTAVDWSADGRLAAVVDGAVFVWGSLDAQARQLRAESRASGPIRWSTAGHLAVAGDNGLYVWGPDQLAATEPRPVTVAGFRPVAAAWSIGLRLAAVDRSELRIWDFSRKADEVLAYASQQPLAELTTEQRAAYGLPPL